MIKAHICLSTRGTAPLAMSEGAPILRAALIVLLNSTLLSKDYLHFDLGKVSNMVSLRPH